MLKESNGRMDRPSSRWVSLRKLSILCNLSIPPFVHPSSSITASTSSRSGSIYSGLARRRYKTWVNVYGHKWAGLHYRRKSETGVMTYRRRCMDSCKIDEEQSPCQAFDGPLYSLGLTHEPHQHIVLYIKCVMREISDIMI